MTGMKKYAAGISFLIVLFLVPFEASSEISQVVPSLALRGEYNDNIFFSVSDEMDDYITTLSPAIKLEQLAERYDVSVDGRLDGIYYADYDQLNAWDYFFKGKFDYQLTPRAGLYALASYTRDSQTGRDIEATGLVLGIDTRHRQNYALSWHYLLADERTTVGLSYNYIEDDFTDRKLLDFTAHNFNLGFSRSLAAFNRPTVGRLNIGYGRYDYTEMQTDNYRMIFGARHEVSEILSLDLEIGPRYTQSTFVITGQDKGDWGGDGRISLSSTGEHTFGKVELAHYLGEASGRFGTAERTSLVIYLTRRFTEKFQGNLDGGYYRNHRPYRSQIMVLNLDERTFRCRPWIRYNFTKDIGLVTSYTYTWIEDRENNTERVRNLVFVRLDLQTALFE